MLALLTGTLDAAELRLRERDVRARRRPALHAVPRARRRRRALPRRVAMALAGDDGLVTGLDRDFAGIAARPPVGDAAASSAGIGPPRRGWTRCPRRSRRPAARCRPRSRSGRRASFSLADLSIRPAILADEALGDAFAARYLEPLAGIGRLGAELETTLRAWFDQEMRVEDTARALHMHPNTLRHRLRRFEEATGATLRDPRDLVELWWALERRRLAG